MELVNLTPYAADRSIAMDGTGREVLLVLVKATFALDTGAPVLADQQDALVMADAYTGEPGASSLARAGEACLFKPAADVVVTGSAHTHRSRRTEALVVLDVGPLRKAVQAVGDRTWQGARGSSISPPASFIEMPLAYERAFGGRDETSDPPEAWEANPVGVGFRGKGSRAPLDGAPLPNLEDPRRPITRPTDRPPSVGLGPIAPAWSPRPGYAGTYDAAWERSRMPLPPADFDPRFDHAAPPDQVLRGYVAGGELVSITSVRPDGGSYRFALPALAPEVVVRIGGERQTPRFVCDTVVIDCAAQRLWLVGRAATSVHGRIAELEWIKIQGPPGAGGADGGAVRA